MEWLGVGKGGVVVKVWLGTNGMGLWGWLECVGVGELLGELEWRGSWYGVVGMCWHVRYMVGGGGVVLVVSMGRLELS